MEADTPQPCKLCQQPTPKMLEGGAAVGPTRGTFCLFICDGCWYLYEKQGIGRADIEAEIRRQVLATGSPA